MSLNYIINIIIISATIFPKRNLIENQLERKKTYVFFCCYFTFTCSNQDDSMIVNSDLIEEWELTKNLCFCAEIPEINEGDQIWEFERFRQNIKVKNTVSNPIFSNGDYRYKLKGDSIFIDFDNSNSNHISKYKYFIEADTLRIEHQPALD